MVLTNNKMKRKIPLFKLNAAPGIKIDYGQMIFTPGVKGIILEETFKAIKDGIDKNKKTTSIYEIAHSNYYIDLERTKWKTNLEKIMNFYLEKEDYDKCTECRDLINKI